MKSGDFGGKAGIIGSETSVLQGKRGALPGEGEEIARSILIQHGMQQDRSKDESKEQRGPLTNGALE